MIAVTLLLHFVVKCSPCLFEELSLGGTLILELLFKFLRERVDFSFVALVQQLDKGLVLMNGGVQSVLVLASGLFGLTRMLV